MCSVVNFCGINQSDKCCIRPHLRRWFVPRRSISPCIDECGCDAIWIPFSGNLMKKGWNKTIEILDVNGNEKERLSQISVNLHYQVITAIYDRWHSHHNKSVNLWLHDIVNHLQWCSHCDRKCQVNSNAHLLPMPHQQFNEGGQLFWMWVSTAQDLLWSYPW